MPTLKKEIFMRPTRMTHRFGERDDPFQPHSEQTFSALYVPPLPKPSRERAPTKLGIKTHGLHVYTEPFSGIHKFRGGNASLSGPTLDNPDAMADPIPASTEMRRTQGPVTPGKKKDGK